MLCVEGVERRAELAVGAYSAQKTGCWVEVFRVRARAVVEELADELEGQVKVGKVNVDEEAALALKYQIMSIPTLVVMKKGVFEGKSIGVQDKDEVLKLLAL